MNAVRKKDGFLMRLSDKVYDLDGYAYTWDEVELVINGKPQSELVSDVDYEALRNQAAIAAMQAQVSSFKTMENLVSILKKRGDEEAEALGILVAIRSVAYADALIAELKKEKP